MNTNNHTMKKAPKLPQRETPDGESGGSQNLLTNSFPNTVKTASQVNAKSNVFDPQISMVASASNTRTTTTTLRNVLACIRDGQWREEVERVRQAHKAGGKEAASPLKKQLPGALFSGTFTVRSTAGLAQHSGLICVDLDDLGDALPAARKKIEADPHTLKLFLSPSGTGLKVLLRCDPLRPHRESFNAARGHFRDRFGLEIDNACSDVSRNCFVSYDPDLFAREDAPLIPYAAEDATNLDIGSAQNTDDDGVVPMPDDFGSVSKEEVRQMLARIPTRPEYDKWLRISSAVFSALPYDDGFEVLNEWSPEENAGEYAEKYQTRLNEVKIGTLVYYARQVIPSLPTSPADLAGRLASRRFDHSTPPQKPEPRFSINGRVVCTAGNLTTIGAQAKTGKSATIGAMIAAVMCADLSITGRDTLGFTANPPGKKRLLHLDSEQSHFDADQLIRRSLKRAGASVAPDCLVSYQLAGFSAKDLVASLKLQMTALHADGGIYAVILDGVADLVHDVNDATECNDFVANLHALAIGCDCPIICVLHENPAQDSGKMRGHLGSQLERKAESNLRLKRGGEITVVSGDKMRGAPILERDGPRFQWSPIDEMHMSTSTVGQTSDDKKREKMEALAEDVFHQGGVTSSRHGDLIKGIMAVRNIKASAAEDRFDDMNKLGVITKDKKTGLWMLSPI